MNIAQNALRGDVADRYLDLLMRSLTRFDGLDDLKPDPFRTHPNPLMKLAAKVAGGVLSKRQCEIVRRIPFNEKKRRLGRDLPLYADTMIGLKRLQNVRDAVRTVVEQCIPGDLVETGVWRGGASILMRAALEAYGDESKTLWCCDSFEGLPAPDMERYPQDDGMDWHTMPILAVSMEQVKANFEKYGLLDDRVRFLKGWFKDTLPTAPISEISVLRMDGDLYASTMETLTALYRRVSRGGFIIVDDYGIPQDVCRRAVEDFRQENRITTPIIDIDGWGKYWRKE